MNGYYQYLHNFRHSFNPLSTGVTTKIFDPVVYKEPSFHSLLFLTEILEPRFMGTPVQEYKPLNFRA